MTRSLWLFVLRLFVLRLLVLRLFVLRLFVLRLFSTYYIEAVREQVKCPYKTSAEEAHLHEYEFLISDDISSQLSVWVLLLHVPSPFVGPVLFKRRSIIAQRALIWKETSRFSLWVWRPVLWLQLVLYSVFHLSRRFCPFGGRLLNSIQIVCERELGSLTKTVKKKLTGWISMQASQNKAALQYFGCFLASWATTNPHSAWYRFLHLSQNSSPQLPWPLGPALICTSGFPKHNKVQKRGGLLSVTQP